ncbi:MAG: hypothetical protein QXF12_00880 [Candidatus Aenigmatarchaeota archaeon]
MEKEEKNSLEEEARKLGFWAMPPTIEEFLDLLNIKNSIYPFWLEHLKKVFPDNIHVNNSYLLLTGAIGTGKSTFSKISALYTLCKLLMLKDLTPFYLTITKPIQFLFFHVKMEKARAEFVEYVMEISEMSSFFINLKRKRKSKNLPPMPYQFVADGVRSNSSIGGDVIFYTFSEANFVSEDVIKFKIDQAYKRFKSRFLAAMPYIGNIIIDTSASFEGAVSDVLAEKDDFYIVRASQWDVKPFLYFKKGFFYVHIGSADTPAKIIENEEELSKYEHEKDKIIKVPAELEREFKSNLHTALLDLAGLNIRSPNAIFTNDMILNIMTIETRIPDVDVIHNLLYHVDEIDRTINKDYWYYIHFDTSIKGDNTGIAMVCWDSPDTLMAPFLIGVHNYGDDIPMFILEEFIKVLIEKGFTIRMVSSDSYQSYKLLQDITRKYRIETKVINVENNPSIYFGLKKSIIDKKIKIVKNNHLIKEMSNLSFINVNGKPKIEHKTNTTKDISDALACAHYNAMEDGKKNMVIIPDNFKDTLEGYYKIVVEKRNMNVFDYNLKNLFIKEYKKDI